MTPLSIVHLCAPASVGGLERVVQGLALGLTRNDHDVTVAAVVEPGASVDEFFRPLVEEGVRTIAMEIPARSYLREMKEVARLLDATAPDVLHTHGPRSDILHGFAARRRDIATVTTIHGYSQTTSRATPTYWLHRKAIARYEAVVAVSPPISATLLELGVREARIHVVPNAWLPPEVELAPDEARAALGIDPGGGEPLIGWVGRLVPVKGADIFVRALGLLLDIDWKAVIIGDGPERERLSSLASELDLEPRVTFCGQVNDAGRSFPAFQLFVLSSRSEGTPVALLEAFGSSVPIVAARVGGVPHMINDGEEGWLVDPESPAALANAIRNVLADPSEAKRRGQRARARAREEFGGERWISRYLHCYRAALDSRGD